MLALGGPNAGKLVGLASTQLAQDSLTVPTVRTEQYLRKLVRILHPDAAVAECTLGPAEQELARRIMQIDGILIREYELDAAKRIIRSGPLHQCVAEISPRHL